MTAQVSKILVWDAPTRVFHWLLALSFVGAYATGDSERWRDIHVALGYTMSGLIGFRVLWGLVGTRHARFESFAYGPGRILRYLLSILRGKPEHYPGHNPAGSLAVYLLLACGVTVVMSGLAAYNEIGGEWLEELHEATSHAMLALVLIHIAGVVASSVLHRENLVRAMVTGMKQGQPEQGISRQHTWLAMLLFGAVVAFWYA
jgi:cytochrome b